eukprot:1303297-Rhodomonas_salina.1
MMRRSWREAAAAAIACADRIPTTTAGVQESPRKKENVSETGFGVQALCTASAHHDPLLLSSKATAMDAPQLVHPEIQMQQPAISAQLVPGMRLLVFDFAVQHQGHGEKGIGRGPVCETRRPESARVEETASCFTSALNTTACACTDVRVSGQCAGAGLTRRTW